MKIHAIHLYGLEAQSDKSSKNCKHLLKTLIKKYKFDIRVDHFKIHSFKRSKTGVGKNYNELL